MSSKKISLLESHCEKILVATLGLFLVVVIIWQLLFQQINIKVGSSTVTLGEIENKLVDKERTVANKLDLSSPCPLEIPEKREVATMEIFLQQRDVAVAPKDSLIPNQPSFGKLLSGSTVANNQWFYQPIYPAQELKGTLITTDSFDYDKMSVQDKEDPFFKKKLQIASSDVTWLSPWGVINLAALRKELKAEDKLSKPVKEMIPPPWSNESLYIIDVLFERQKKDPAGDWTDLSVVSIAPLQQGSFREEIKTLEKDQASSKSVSLRETIFLNFSQREVQLDVLQPSLPPMKGENFLDPSQLVASTDAPELSLEDQAEQKLQGKIEEASKKLGKIQADLKVAGGRLEPPKTPDSKGNEGGAKQGGGGGGGGGFGMGGGGSVRKGDSGDDGTDGTQEQKNRRILLTKNLDRALKALETLKKDFAEKYPVAAKETSDSEGSLKVAEKTFGEIDEVYVWTHDFNVEGGATYRYRMTLQVFNPFFTHRVLLIPEQTILADSVATSSVSSEWGPEVTVTYPTSFFVTRGSARVGIAGRKISLDLFRYSDGILRSTSDDIALGDPVGGVVGEKEEAVDFSTDWYLADIFDDAGSDENAGIIAVFERRTSTGGVLREQRSSADKDSEIYKNFKSQLPANAPKKVATQAPKA